MRRFRETFSLLIVNICANLMRISSSVISSTLRVHPRLSHHSPEHSKPNPDPALISNNIIFEVFRGLVSDLGENSRAWRGREIGIGRIKYSEFHPFFSCRCLCDNSVQLRDPGLNLTSTFSEERESFLFPVTNMLRPLRALIQ